MYANAFNLFIYVMQVAVVFFAVVAVGLVFVLAIIHRRNLRQVHRHDTLREQWQKTFRNAFTMPTKATNGMLPPLADNDRFTVLLVFRSIRELRQTDRQKQQAGAAILDRMARKLGLDMYARTLLERGDDSDRILAVSVLGQMGDRSILPAVKTLLDARGLELSQAAAQCMLRLDPQTIDEVIFRVRDRDDWVWPRVDQMLREVDSRYLDPAMEGAVRASDEKSKRQLLEFLGCCSKGMARSICLEVIEQTEDPETVAAALRALAPYAKSEDNPIVYRYVKTGSWFVRLAALRVLEPIVSEKDLPVLEILAADSDWWIRHRASEILVTSQHGEDYAQALAKMHPDAYARDAIAQAIAEQKLGLKDTALVDQRARANRGPENRK